MRHDQADLAACVARVVAWDVLLNFEQRWRKQSGCPGELLNMTVQVRKAFAFPGMYPSAWISPIVSELASRGAHGQSLSTVWRSALENAMR